MNRRRLRYNGYISKREQTEGIDTMNAVAAEINRKAAASTTRALNADLAAEGLPAMQPTGDLFGQKLDSGKWATWFEYTGPQGAYGWVTIERPDLTALGQFTASVAAMSEID